MMSNGCDALANAVLNRPERGEAPVTATRPLIILISLLNGNTKSKYKQDITMSDFY
jgi:hypothetical protein